MADTTAGTRGQGSDDFALRKLKLLEQKCATLKNIRSSGGSAEEIAFAEKAYETAIKAIKKEERALRATRAPTAKRKRVIDLALKEQSYTPALKVPAGQEKAKEVLREILGNDSFYTPPFGACCCPMLRTETPTPPCDDSIISKLTYARRAAWLQQAHLLPRWQQWLLQDRFRAQGWIRLCSHLGCRVQRRRSPGRA